jgi:hypothetical protein
MPGHAAEHTFACQIQDPPVRRDANDIHLGDTAQHNTMMPRENGTEPASQTKIRPLPDFYLF